METIIIYDQDGRELPITADLLKAMLKQEFPQMAIVNIDDVYAMLTKTTELETIVSKSVEMIVIVHELIGNRYPTKVTDLVTLVPKLMTKLSGNPEIIEQLKEKLQTIRQIAPAHLAPELVNKIESFTPKTLPSG